MGRESGGSTASPGASAESVRGGWWPVRLGLHLSGFPCQASWESNQGCSGPQRGSLVGWGLEVRPPLTSSLGSSLCWGGHLEGTTCLSLLTLSRMCYVLSPRLTTSQRQQLLTLQILPPGPPSGSVYSLPRGQALPYPGPLPGALPDFGPPSPSPPHHWCWTKYPKTLLGPALAPKAPGVSVCERLAAGTDTLPLGMAQAWSTVTPSVLEC